MKFLACAVAATCLSTSASACPMTDALVERYGISFSGFTVEIPDGQAPDVAPGDALVRIAIPDTSHVADGFRHSVVLDTVKKKAWILRTGGFVGVYKWYGPVDVTTTSLDNCRLEHVSALVRTKQAN
jgi:hypothetical protein